MKFSKMSLLFTASTLLLAACGSAGASTESNTQSEGNSAVKTAALITDTNGVDDRSFNQSAWEGMVEWGAEHALEQGNAGYQYFQSSNESDYIPNIDQALNAGFETIFGIGYKLSQRIQIMLGSLQKVHAFSLVVLQR